MTWKVRMSGLAFLFVLGNAGAAQHDHEAAPAGAQGEAAPPRLLVDAPVAAYLGRGVLVLPFRTENLKVAPVYGDAAQGMTPRPGHLHVTVDHAVWHWVHASPDPLVIQGLPTGPHQVTLDLADANHRTLQSVDVSFTVP